MLFGYSSNKLPNNVEKDERNRDRVVRHTLGEGTIWRVSNEARERPVLGHSRAQCQGPEAEAFFVFSNKSKGLSHWNRTVGEWQ